MRHFLWPLGVVVAFGLGLAAASFYPDAHPTAPPRRTCRRWSAACRCRSARCRRGCASARPIRRSSRRRPRDRPPRPSSRGPPPSRGGRRCRSAPGRAPGDAAATRRASPRTTSPRRPACRARPPSPRRRWTARSTASTATSEAGAGTTGPARWRQARELAAELKAMGDAGTEALARVLTAGRAARSGAPPPSSWASCRIRAPCRSCRTSSTRTATCCCGARRRRGCGASSTPESVPVLETLMVNPADDRFVRMSAAYRAGPAWGGRRASTG